jgi:hypothetical protein
MNISTDFDSASYSQEYGSKTGGRRRYIMLRQNKHKIGKRTRSRSRTRSRTRTRSVKRNTKKTGGQRLSSRAGRIRRK